jgi:hypothetical protein
MAACEAGPYIIFGDFTGALWFLRSYSIVGNLLRAAGTVGFYIYW